MVECSSKSDSGFRGDFGDLLPSCLTPGGDGTDTLTLTLEVE